MPANRALRCIRQTKLFLSRASLAPTSTAYSVGAVLARDAGAAVHQIDRVVLIAGKHRSHMNESHSIRGNEFIREGNGESNEYGSGIRKRKQVGCQAASRGF